MSTKIFKVSNRTKRDGLDYDTFMKKLCLESFEDDKICSPFEKAHFSIDMLRHETKSKHSRKVKYEDVCPKQHPYVSGLVIGIMDEIEKRIPPLVNMTLGLNEKATKKNETLLDNVIHDCKYVKDLPSILFEESNWSLFQILLLFLDRLEVPVFCTNIDMSTLNKLDNYPMQHNFGESKQKLTQVLDLNLKEMRREQVATTAFIMQKVQLWALMNVKYYLEIDSFLEWDEVYLESINFFRLLLGPVIVGFPSAYENYVKFKNSKRCNGDKIYNHALKAGHIFSVMVCNASFDYWHDKSLEIFNSPLLNTPSPITIESGKRPSILRISESSG